MIVALVALFVALGGSVYAAEKIGTKQLKNGAVSTKKIKNNAVTSGKIANDAVIASKIDNGAVGTAQLANNAVTTGKIASSAVTTGRIANSAVEANKIAAAAVTATQIANGAVTKAKLAAQGTATNASMYSLATGQCTQDTTFTAAGVEPGDVVWFSFRDSAAGTLSASPADGTVAAPGSLHITICNQGAVANITPGSLVLDYVAIR